MGQMPPAQWARHCDGGVAQLTPAACSCCVQPTQLPSVQPASLTTLRVASHRTWYVPHQAPGGHAGMGTGVGSAGSIMALILALMERGRRLTTAEPDAMPAVAAMSTSQDGMDPTPPPLRGWARVVAGGSPDRQDDGGTVSMFSYNYVR